MTWLGSWENRIAVFVDYTKIDSNLTHFPVPVKITGTDAEDIITDLGSSSKKIAVTDSDGDQLYCEIEQWGILENKICIWVSRSDWVISSTLQTVFYLYYDSAQPDNTGYVGEAGSAAAKNVWDSGFAGVYLLGGSYDGTIAEVKDSSSNEKHLTAGLLSGGIPTQSELLGISQNFTPSQDLSGDIYDPIGTKEITIETFFNANDTGTYNTLLSNNTADGGMLSGILIDQNRLFIMDICDESITIPTGIPCHLSIRITPSIAECYINGVLEVYTTHSNDIGRCRVQWQLGYRGTSYPRGFSGKIDMVRITNSTRSVEWIKADYHAQNNNLISFNFSEITLDNIITEPPVFSPLKINSEDYFYTKFKNTAQFVWKTRPQFRWKTFSFYAGSAFPVLLLIEEYNDVFTPIKDISENYGLKLSSEVVENYGLKLVMDIEELYHITQTISQYIELFYGIKLQLSLAEFYSDAPIPKKTINEYYGDAYTPLKVITISYKDAFIPVLLTNEMYENIPYAAAVIWEVYRDAPRAKKLIEEKYGDTLESKRIVEMKYNNALSSNISISEPYQTSLEAQKIVSESYGISNNQILNSLSEVYNIKALNSVQNSYEEIYYMMPDDVVIPVITASVTVDGEEIDFIGVEIDIDIDQYAIIGTITLADEENYLKCKYLSELICVLDDTTYVFFIENKTKTTEHAGVSYQINVVSPTVKLGTPYSSTLIEEFPDGVQAETLVNQMASMQSVSVDYQLLDWFIPSYAISINNETPLSVIRRIVNAAGGVVQTKPDGTLLLISKYEESPKDWDSIVSTNILSSVDKITYLSESLKINDGFNAFLITDQGSSTADITLEEVDVDSNTKIIRGFRVPFTDGAFDLLTSGGDLVTIDKTTDSILENVPIADLEGNITEEWEYVEFIDWVGKTRYPIYELIDSDWEEENLGAFQISEEGTLTIINQESVPGESLLKIKYKTKYWKWTVTGLEGKHVQFYVPEEE